MYSMASSVNRAWSAMAETLPTRDDRPRHARRHLPTGATVSGDQERTDDPTTGRARHRPDERCLHRQRPPRRLRLDAPARAGLLRRGQRPVGRRRATTTSRPWPPTPPPSPTPAASAPSSRPLAMMIDFDAPEHVRRRRLVSAGFTPRRVRAMEDHVRAICDRVHRRGLRARRVRLRDRGGRAPAPGRHRRHARRGRGRPARPAALVRGDAALPGDTDPRDHRGRRPGLRRSTRRTWTR